MPNPDEKAAFSARLKKALKRSQKKVETATELAVQFNLRHPSEPVTQQAAQKWLTGQARPTVDKIKTLAEWLGVSEQWLRYGVTDEKRPSTKAAAKEVKSIALTPNELELIVRLRDLPEARRELVVGIVEQFHLDVESWRE